MDVLLHCLHVLFFAEWQNPELSCPRSTAVDAVFMCLFAEQVKMKRRLEMGKLQLLPKKKTRMQEK